MSLRLIVRSHTVTTKDGETNQVRVYKDTETGEFRVRFYFNGKLYAPADYFTDDKQDALDTADRCLKGWNSPENQG